VAQLFSFGVMTSMAALSKFLLVLSVAFVTYGLARWQVVTEVLSRQERHLDTYFKSQAEQFFAGLTADAAQSTNWSMPPDLRRLRNGIMMSAGLYAGWPQAIIPCAFGLVLLAGSYYCRQKAVVAAGRQNAEPGAAPNGGPAAPVGNSGVTEGPPSVS
jgi:hypothetical protein